MPKATNSVLGLVALVLATSARAEDLDTAKLDQARSLVAEAALLERSEGQGRVTRAYAEALRETLKDDLQKLRNEPRFRAVADQALAALDRRDAAALAALRDRLVALERAHGRAA